MTKSIAKFGDSVSPEMKKSLQSQKKRSCTKTDPIYLKKLNDAVKSQDITSDLLGYTSTGISQALSDPEGVRLSLELAAQYIYEKDFMPKQPQSKKLIAIVQHDHNSMKFIQEMVRNTNGKITIIE